MSLLDDVTAEQGVQTIRCHVSIVRGRMTEEERADLDTVLTATDEDGNYLYAAEPIHRGVKKSGHSLMPDSIRRHRRGVCRCPA
jgi:hypothetical protein